MKLKFYKSPIILILLTFVSACAWLIFSQNTAEAYFAWHENNNQVTYNVYKNGCYQIEGSLFEDTLPDDVTDEYLSIRSKNNTLFVGPLDETEPVYGWPSVTIWSTSDDYSLNHFSAQHWKASNWDYMMCSESATRDPLKMTQSRWRQTSENYTNYYACFSNRFYTDSVNAKDDDKERGYLTYDSNYFYLYQASQDSNERPAGSDSTYPYFTNSPFNKYHRGTNPETGEEIYEYSFELLPTYKFVATEKDEGTGEYSLILENTSEHAYYFGDTYVPIVAHPKKGCYVDHWTYEPKYDSEPNAEKFTGEVSPGEEVHFDDETIFSINAVFAGEPSWDVTFDQNDGDSPDYPQTILTPIGSKYTLPENNPWRTGYDFDGWWTDPDNGIKITSDSIFNMDNNQTLYAHWKIKTPMVYFDNKGHGTPNPGEKEVTYNQPYGELASISEEGYIFGGWYFNSDCTGDPVTTSTIVTNTEDHSLYAKWTPKLIYVYFDYNGRGSDPYSSKEINFDDTYGYLPVPTCEGYTFGGWYLNRECSGSQVTSTTTCKIPNNHTLYAKWTANTYEVTFNLNGHGTKTPNQITVTFDSKYGDLESPTCQGYTFDGWYFNSSCSGEKVTSTTTVTTARNHTLYAKWSAASYYVSFDISGHGSTQPKPIPVTFDSPYGELPTITCEGYTFDGWYLDNPSLEAAKSSSLHINEAQKVTSSTIVKTASDHTLYAKWTANKYLTTFDSNGATNPASPSSIEQTYDSLYIFPDVEPKKTGYNFGGWWTDPTGGNQVTLNDKVAITAPQILYAHWNINQPLVTFDENDGTTPANPKQIVETFDSNYILPETEPTKNNYTFDGWWTEPLEGVQITKTTKVENPDNHTLYAHWKLVVVHTPPTAIEGLVFNGSFQTLVNPGTTNAGTIYYAIGVDDKTPPTTIWLTDLPVGIDTGDYYIWYKIENSDESLSVPPTFACCVSIANANILDSIFDNSYFAPQTLDYLIVAIEILGLLFACSIITFAIFRIRRKRK